MKFEHTTTIQQVDGNDSIEEKSQVKMKTNKETIDWMTKQSNSLSQAEISDETRIFFGAVKNMTKIIVSKKITEFKKGHEALVQTIKRKIMKDKNGIGKNNANPPDSFKPKLKSLNFINEDDLSCTKCDEVFDNPDDLLDHISIVHERARREAFNKESLNEVKTHKDYVKWENENTEISNLTFKNEEEQLLYNQESTKSETIKQLTEQLHKEKTKVSNLSKEKEILEESKQSHDNTFHITKQRSAGPNIVETERSILSVQDSGCVNKTVVKDVFAKITTREGLKRLSENKENEGTKRQKLSKNGLKKRAGVVANILKHVGSHDTATQAMIVAKVVDKNGPEFASEVTKNSKEIQSGLKMSPYETASMTAGITDSAANKLRTAMNKKKGWNMLASHRQVKKTRVSQLPFGKEAWDFQKLMLYKNKQGQNKRTQTLTDVAIVKNLKSYIQLHGEFESDELNGDEELPVVLGGDAGGGRFVAEFTFKNRKDGSLKLHPILIYEGTDNRENLQKTLGQLTQQIRALDGSTIIINSKEHKVKLFCVLDLCALNSVLGKQNHSSTYPDAWTDVMKEHLSFKAHTGKPHTPSSCVDVKYVTLEYLEKQFTHHAVDTGETSGMNETGKSFGSVINHNLIPLKDIFRFVPPLLHIIMGLGNNVFTQLKNEVLKLDETENNVDEMGQRFTEDLKNLYSKKEELENKFSDIQLAHMIIINDLSRVKLLKEGKLDEAEKKALENYETKSKNKKKKVEKNNCDAEICVVFPCDEANAFDDEFDCHNKCKIHLRCEGRTLEDGSLPENYVCEECQTGATNKHWLEEKINERKNSFNEEVEKLKDEHNHITMKIEHIEEDESKVGPRQRRLKESCKNLGLNPARYHGGDFEGKAVQTMLDCARKPYRFELLDCLFDKPEEKEKYVRALTTLAKVSDVLKTPMPNFDDEDVKTITKFCEEWGHNWLEDFKKNLTPKGHDLIFVIPQFIKHHRNFYMFYKIEQAGESIHATLNEIQRKIWSIRDGKQRMWKYIENYELRNVLDISIVAPNKRIFKKRNL